MPRRPSLESQLADVQRALFRVHRVLATTDVDQESGFVSVMTYVIAHGEFNRLQSLETGILRRLRYCDMRREIERLRVEQRAYRGLGPWVQPFLRELAVEMPDVVIELAHAGAARLGSLVRLYLMPMAEQVSPRAARPWRVADVLAGHTEGAEVPSLASPVDRGRASEERLPELEPGMAAPEPISERGGGHDRPERAA